MPFHYLSTLFRILLVGFMLGLGSIQAQSSDPTPKPDRYLGKFTILAGLSQPIFLSGYNLAATYFTSKWSFEYSHGWSLDYPTAIRDENLLSLSSPYSTGFGVGYRFTRNFDLRAEFKANGYQAQLINGETLEYTTFVIGLGAYYRLHLWRGIILEPSLRYWPNLSSTLPGNLHTYAATDGATLTHEANDYGLFANVSIGYVIGSHR